KQTFLFFILFFLSVILIPGCSADKHPAFIDSGTALEGKWFYRFSEVPPEISPEGKLQSPVPGDEWSETDVPNFPQEKKTPWLWIRTRLPEINYGEPMLVFGTVDQCFDLFVNGQRISRYGSPENQLGIYGTHEVPLPENCAGKELSFIIYSSTTVIGILDPIFYGPRGGHFLRILRNEGFQFIVSMFFILCSLILIPLILNKSYLKLFMFFSVFSLCLGLYLISRLHLKDFIFPDFTSWGYVELPALYLMTYSFIQFLRFSEIFPSRFILKFLCRIMSIVLPVLLVTSIIFPNILQLALIPWDLYLLVFALYFLIRSIHMFFVPAPLKTRVFSISIIIFSIIVMHDVFVAVHFLPWQAFWMVPGLILIYLSLLFIIREDLMRVFRESLEKSALLKKSFDKVTTLNEKLSQRLVTDDFTGLPNRLQLETDLRTGIHDILILDIKGLSGYNIGYGTEVGNRILLCFVARLKLFINEWGKLYRLASDEFIIDLNSGVDAENCARNLINHFRTNRLEVDDLHLYVQFSIGVLIREEGNLLQKANIALKNAKRSHTGGYAVLEQVREEDTHSRYIENIQWTKKIREAIDNDRIVPYFQGIHDNRTGILDKYECLMRMEENGAIIGPNAFIDIARHSGAMKELTAIMMEKCFHVFSGRTEEFSINLDEECLEDENLYRSTVKLLEKYSIKPGQVTYELLEGIEGKSELYADRIRQLKELGIKIAIDDFGTAYSNFSRLLDMHVDYIKIDGSLIRSIDSNPNFFTIVHGIKSLADNIHAEVVAEFVHNDQVQARIMELGIEYSQGYFFSEPNPALLSSAQ
ncbi:MAG: EAL domain-containing protein, partial [Spirochaetales bacterium]|nr:EAL domain-containing protein [Spirochaetales bacterium]